MKTFAAIALLGAAVAAHPQSWDKGHGTPSAYSGHMPKDASGASPPSAGQTPFSFPLANGFPDVSNDTLLKIEQAAHGTLPNGPTPSSLDSTSVTVLELIAFNELFEVAFFTSLIQNITSNVDGFKIESPGLKNFVLNALTAVQAQEELHALGANGILTGAGQEAIQPCKYVFPSADLDSAIRFASTFTDVVLGTLQDAQAAFSTDGDAALVPLIGSVIGQEGEQNGYYRSLLDLIPSSQPFLTRSAGPFAFSALNQQVIVNGSCPNENLINLPIFGALTVVTQNIQLKDQTISFSVKSDAADASSWSVVFINGQKVPVTVPVSKVKNSDGVITFDAQFNAATLIADGLTIAAVTKTKGPFADVPSVAAATLFGPGLIEIM